MNQGSVIALWVGGGFLLIIIIVIVYFIIKNNSNTQEPKWMETPGRYCDLLPFSGATGIPRPILHNYDPNINNKDLVTICKDTALNPYASPTVECINVADHRYCTYRSGCSPTPLTGCSSDAGWVNYQLI